VKIIPLKNSLLLKSINQDEEKFEEKEIIIENGNFFARFNVSQIKEDGDTDCFILDYFGQFGFQ